MVEKPYSIIKDTEISYNSSILADEKAFDTLYKCASVYLIILISAGIFLNSKAIVSLLEVIKVNLVFLYGYYKRYFLDRIICSKEYINSYFQTRKTEQNLLLINLIFSELSIATFLPIDFLGSLTYGEIYKSFSFLCQLAGFSQTFFGNS